mmetsp:Transcript_11133/g.68559  ORF Transcript_11133/g.68559 Transcript_11133/m.68559 type:complete len:260 (-) Transcript_11133:228-1007(-)
MRKRLPVRKRSCGVRRGDGRACDWVRTVRVCLARLALVWVRRSSILSSTWTWNQEFATARRTQFVGTMATRACWTPCNAAGDVEAAPSTTPHGRWPSGSSRLVWKTRPRRLRRACVSVVRDPGVRNVADGSFRTKKAKQGSCTQGRLRAGSTCERIAVPVRCSVGDGRRWGLRSVCAGRVLFRSYFDHGPTSGTGHGRRHVVRAKRTQHGQSHGSDPSQRHGSHADGCVSESSASKFDERRIHWISLFVAQHVSIFRRS